ncbi:hypothetical protein FOZ61_010146 [Perkinsus olseni]|uniref:Uncharacterized protein n=1 Tax=Perkinsus olseni TaxID=32597 RepID=A0A7J6MGD1_PEROL|nr:hypothetical protein FOZ61_010146 [Perkinsus olseni]
MLITPKYPSSVIASTLCTFIAIISIVSHAGCSTSSAPVSGGVPGLPSLPPDPNRVPTFPPTTGVPPTSRPPPGNVCSGNRIGTYTWSQSYWLEGDQALLNFLDHPMGRQWNCGDLYINVADASNHNKIKDEDKLVEWMKTWREQSGNNGTIWLTYGDVVEKDGPKMVGFVETFKHFLMRSVSAQDMSLIAPMGISFDVEHVAEEYYERALMDAQMMKEEVTEGMGYLPGSIFVDCTIEGEKNVVETEYVMRHADRALMMLYRNEVNGTYEDDLVERMKWMMTEQCTVCTQPGWENLRAKITIMVEGACEMGSGCKKLSMCAKDTSSYPDSQGGIQYIWETLQELRRRMIADEIVTQEQFDHIFDVDGTLFAVHNWEWSRCFYGDSFSQEMSFSNCHDYHPLASDCRMQ